jgi:hypothetical protein
VGHEYDSSAFPSAVHDRYGRRADASAGKAIFDCVRDSTRSPSRASSRARMGCRGPEAVLHPWEIGPGQARVRRLPGSYWFRHYANLQRAEPRLEPLLADFDWTAIGDLLRSRDGRHGHAIASRGGTRVSPPDPRPAL